MSKLLEQINNEKVGYQISELMDIKYGFGLPERDRIKGNIPVYASSGIVGFHNESKVKNPSIIIGRKGNVGSLSYSEKESYPIDTVFYVDEVNEDFDLKYVYYLLQRINLPKYGGDSAVPGLSRDTIYSLLVDVPKKVSQQKVSSILSAYDSKIENNNKIIKNLEATAQTIFNEWFVNFKFPGYEKVKMVDSEVGEIPDGWKVGKVSDFGNVICGKTPSKSNPDFFGGNIPFIKIPDMHGQMFIVNTEDSLTEKGADTQINKLVPEGSICVSCIATVGLVSIATRDSQTNQQINTVVPKDKKFMEYLYFTLIDMRADLQAIGSGGSTTLNVNTSVFSNIEVVIPNKDILEKFHTVVMPMFDGVRRMINENISLRSQRDQLLAKLI